jgi:hypothetical protein
MTTVLELDLDVEACHIANAADSPANTTIQKPILDSLRKHFNLEVSVPFLLAAE